MHLPSWILKRQFQNAEFKADISVCPVVPPPFLKTCWKSFQAKFESPICWIEIDLSEVSKPKIERSKAQHTRLICWRNQCQTKHTVYAGKPTSFMSINPIQVKFMWLMSSWVYKRLKYLKVSLSVEFMHTWYAARNIRLLSYYQ